ncbi:hypothetical protein FANTH_10219 [Fusarium anthophilum]|uniref:Uncharacterized protein n=1 Tax=Fusarium anthophilum TaxID=48485 RepID=A0A8H4Z2I5_9HYPO|nr:hypothetical protein FANTH_10219 [Fusarium anthophilum]
MSVPAKANATMVIDGLLASLIYFNETNSSATHVLSTKPQSLMRWEAILDFHFEIQRYWQSLVDIAQKGDLPGLHILLESFPTSTHLYETAIFTFRNTLTGSEPDDLHVIFALCSLSYLALRHSQKISKPDPDNIFRDINIWRDSIGNPQHRQLFDELIQRLWENMTAPSFQTQLLHSTSLVNSQDYILPQSAIMQDISLFGDCADPFWGGLFEVPGSFQGPNFQMTGTTPGRHPTVLDSPEHQLSAGDLRQSAVMNILTSFIANCGDLVDILSGYGATAKGPHSDVPLEVKNFAQALRRHDCFGDPSARGILAIVDRFVDLNYFQSIDEIRDYIIIVGKEILPSGHTFAKVCKAVYSSTEMTKVPRVARRQHDRKL